MRLSVVKLGLENKSKIWSCIRKEDDVKRLGQATLRLCKQKRSLVRDVPRGASRTSDLFCLHNRRVACPSLFTSSSFLIHDHIFDLFSKPNLTTDNRMCNNKVVFYSFIVYLRFSISHVQELISDFG